MDSGEKADEEVIIDANSTEVEVLVDDLPSAEESDLKPSLTSPGEPEPFDPLSAIDAAESAAIDNPLANETVSGEIEVNEDVDAAAEAETAKNETPTPETIAAELKEVAAKTGMIKETDEPEPETPKEPTVTAPVVPEKTEKKKHFSSALLILLILIILAVAAVCAALFLIKKPDTDGGERKNTASSKNTVPKEKIYDYIVGAWESQAEGGSCYIFDTDETFYWLRDCEDFSDNYYYGKVNSVERGQKALKAVNTDLEGIKQMLQMDDDSIIDDDIFFIKLAAAERKVAGVDTSATLGKDFIQLLFVRSEDSDIARGYQYNSGDMYVFSLNPEIKAPARNTTPAQ